jgi:transposase-like protein
LPTEIALFKALSLAVAAVEKPWTMRTGNWQKIMARLSIFCRERLKDDRCAPSTRSAYTVFGTRPA